MSRILTRHVGTFLTRLTSYRVGAGSGLVSSSTWLTHCLPGLGPRGERGHGPVARIDLSTDMLAFDSTNCDTHIATTTPGELARCDLRVVGLGVLVNETGHVPLLHPGQ